MNWCPFFAKYGLPLTYVKENDQHLPSFVKTTKRCNRNKGLDTDNSRKAAAIDKRVKEQKDKEVENKRAAAAGASLQPVSKGDRDMKTLNKESVFIKQNFDVQTIETNTRGMRHI